MPEAAPRLKPTPLPRLARRAGGGAYDRLLLAFDLLFVLLLGALHSVPAAYPQAWWLQIAGAAGLAWRVSRATPGRAAALGLVFGTAWLGAGVWWLFVSMHRYGGLPAGLAVAAVLALSAFLSLYLAAAMALFARLRRHRVALDAALFGACWLLAELARAALFTGFPWAAAGYAHVDSPLAMLAPWVGVYGIGFVCAVLGAGLVLGMRASSGVGAGTGAVLGLLFTGAVLVLLGLSAPTSFTRPTGTLKVSLLQTNVPQDEKFAAEHMAQSLSWAASQLLAARGDFVLAPETVIPLLPEQLDPAYWQPISRHFQQGDRAALIGRPLGSFETAYTNSAVGISRDTVRQPDGFYRYDKYHLVPFGEFIPRGFRWFTDLMDIPLGDFHRGPLVPVSFAVKGERVAPNICYEDLFGEELAARFADMNTAPTLFANLSNIGWFGDTIAVNQHLHISRMRTLEFQRPMLRSTNTGSTVVIDHTGRVTHALQPFTRGVLEGEVQGRDGLTPYTWWASRYGLWPLLAAALLILLVMVPLRRRAD